jgi:hypothetical protein
VGTLAISSIPRAYERVSDKKLAADTVESALADYFATRHRRRCVDHCGPNALAGQ